MSKLSLSIREAFPPNLPEIKRQGLFWVWVGLLVVSAIVPLVSIYFEPDNFWITWEIIVLLSTIFFTPAIFLDMHDYTQGELATEQLLTTKGKNLFFKYLVSAAMSLLLATLISIAEAYYDLKVTVIGTTFLVTIASFYYLKAQSQIIRERKSNLNCDQAKKYEERRIQAYNTMWHSDVPTLIIFIILFAFVCVAVFLTSVDHGQLKSFVGGAIGFQLLLSNFIFGMHYALHLK
jgi:hypothetical protein